MSSRIGPTCEEVAALVGPVNTAFAGSFTAAGCFVDRTVNQTGGRPSYISNDWSSNLFKRFKVGRRIVAATVLILFGVPPVTAWNRSELAIDAGSANIDHELCGAFRYSGCCVGHHARSFVREQLSCTDETENDSDTRSEERHPGTGCGALKARRSIFLGFGSLDRRASPQTPPGRSARSAPLRSTAADPNWWPVLDRRIRAS